MGTIEKAREYARNGMSLCMDTSNEQDIYCEDLIQAYLAGAKAEREEITCWHDPKDLPERDKDVLLKIQLIGYDEPMYSIGYWDDSYFSNTLGHHGEVIGWREIHE